MEEEKRGTEEEKWRRTEEEKWHGTEEEKNRERKKRNYGERKKRNDGERKKRNHGERKKRNYEEQNKKDNRISSHLSFKQSLKFLEFYSLSTMLSCSALHKFGSFVSIRLYMVICSWVFLYIYPVAESFISIQQPARYIYPSSLYIYPVAWSLHLSGSRSLHLSGSWSLCVWILIT